MLDYLKKLEKLISSDNMEEAFENFREKLSSILIKAPNAEEDVKDVKNQIIVLSGKLHDLNKKVRMGLIDAHNASVLKAQIIYSFTDLLDNLKNYNLLYAFLEENDEEETWLSAANYNSLHTVKEYLEKYPNGKYNVEAKYLISELEKLSAPRVAQRFPQVVTQIPENIKSQTPEDWWQSLSPRWKHIFATKINLSEKPNFEDLHKIFSINKLDIQGNQEIFSIEPLKKLTKLKTLNISDTRINSLDALKELSNLEVLWFRYTFVSSLDALKNLKKIREIDFYNTEVFDLSPIAELSNLEFINCSLTNVNSLYPIYDMPKLRILNCQTHLLSLENIEQYKLMNPKVRVNEY